MALFLINYLAVANIPAEPSILARSLVSPRRSFLESQTHLYNLRGRAPKPQIFHTRYLHTSVVVTTAVKFGVVKI